MESLIGKTIDKYHILEKLGEGGMGIVYRAKDIILERDVALKIISPEIFRNTDLSKRFLREAKSLAKIDHPNIVMVYDFRQSEIGSFIVMQYVEGITLADLIYEKKVISWQEALPIIKQILSAIGHAHGKGVFHRDLKPRNILLTPTHQVKVTDFGLAKIKQDTELTVTVFKAGTLCYMSPEHVRGLKNVNHLSDIYAVGIMLYELLSGQKPLGDIDSDYEIEQRIIQGKIPSPIKYNPSIPLPLVKIILKAIQKNPSKRFQSADEMLYELNKFEDEHTLIWEKPSPAPVFKSKQPMLIIFASLVVLLFVILLLIKRDKPVPPEVQNVPSMSIITDSPKSIDQIPLLVDAVKNGTLTHGDKLLRIAVIKNLQYGNQMVPQFQNYQKNLFKEVEPEGKYHFLYLGPVDSELSNDKIIKQFELGNIFWGVKHILAVQIVFDEQQGQVSLSYDRSFAVPFNN